MKLASDTALVTGAAQGIGKGIAEELLSHGTSVVIADINETGAEETAAELNEEFSPDVVSVPCDVTDADDVSTAVETAVEQFGELGILVNNAGVGELARTWELTEQMWDDAVDISLKGTFLCTREVINHMLETDTTGTIVNISSINYMAATDGLAHYSAAKAGVSQFTKAVAGEAGRYGIRVNAVAPGSTRTPLTEENELLSGKIGEEFRKRTVLGDRFGEPEDIGKVVAFLASDAAGWVTGETICVDGGQHIRGLHSYWDVLDEMGAFD